MGIALDIWREKRRKEREAMIENAVAEAVADKDAEIALIVSDKDSEIEALKRRIAEKVIIENAVADKDAQIEDLKRRIAELEKSNGDSSV